MDLRKILVFESFSLSDERTAFNLHPDVIVWATNHEHYFSSQEHTFEKRKAGDIGEDEFIGCPILAEISSDTCVMLT